MSPSRRASPAGFSPANNNDEQQPSTALAVSRDSTASRPGRRSSIAAIFDDHRPRDETSSKLMKPNLRRLWANYDVPYIIGEDLRDTKHTLCGRLLILCSWCLLVLFFPFSLFVTLKVVQEYERAVIFSLGRLSDQSARGPGMCFTLPCIDILHLVDILSQSPCAMQLRYLQTLNGIATEQNSTIIFPLPMDLMSIFQKNPTSTAESFVNPFAYLPPDRSTNVVTAGKMIRTPTNI